MIPQEVFGFAVIIDSVRVIHKNSHRRCPIEKDILENFAKFTGNTFARTSKSQVSNLLLYLNLKRDSGTGVYL